MQNTVYLDNKVFLEFDQYPEELLNSWILVTLFDEKNYLGGVCSLYINNKFPSGTIIFSEFIDNDFPDAYVSWEKNGKFNRIYCSPKYRKSGVVTTLGAVARTLVYFKTKVYLIISTDVTEIGLKTMKRGISNILQVKDIESIKDTEHWKDPENINKEIMLDYRDPVPPAHWHSESDFF